MKKYFIVCIMLLCVFVPGVMAKEVKYSEKPVNKIEEKYEVPILGKIKAKEVSLPLLAIVFNPSFIEP